MEARDNRKNLEPLELMAHRRPPDTRSSNGIGIAEEYRAHPRRTVRQCSTRLPMPPACIHGPSPRVSRRLPDQPLPEAARAVRTHATAGTNGGPHRAPHLGVTVCHAGLRAASREWFCSEVWRWLFAQRPAIYHRRPTRQVYCDAVHRPSLVFLTTGVKLRGPEGAQRPRATSASTAELCSSSPSPALDARLPL